MAWQDWKTAYKEGWEEWRDNLEKIWTAGELYGIERLFDWVIYASKFFIVSHHVQLFWGQATNWKARYTDWYVVGILLLLILLQGYNSWFSAVLAGYRLGSIVIYLLNVLFITKLPFGGVASYERSLILFMVNVAQVILIFAIFYRLESSASVVHGALVTAILVFGTIHLPDAEIIAGVQIVIDFMLLAVFLAHFVGKLGAKK